MQNKRGRRQLGDQESGGWTEEAGRNLCASHRNAPQNLTTRLRNDGHWSIPGSLKMELVSNLALGFSVSLQPLNLLLCFMGVALGVVIGILPGLGSAATIALLLPITYFLDTTTAIIMLAGIWYGSMYGGSITSVLLRVPGESPSVLVAVRGYELPKQGRRGAALVTSMF